MAYRKRLNIEYQKLLKSPIPCIQAHPDPKDIRNWYFLFYDLNDSPYEGGVYMGRLIFPDSYPLKPPQIRMITPNGRFHLNANICTTFSSYHPDMWNPAWGVQTVAIGLLSFWHEGGSGIGFIRTTDDQKKRFATQSVKWNKRQNIFNSLFGKSKEWVLIEKNMAAGKTTVFETAESKKRKSERSRSKKGGKKGKGKKGGDRERSRDTKKKSGKKAKDADGPTKLKIKATKFIEHKTEWKIELLFKTPDLRSHKFWKIKCDPASGHKKTVVNFGRYGKKCRVSEKVHPSRAAAENFEAKKIREKQNKGYFKVMMIGSGLGKNSIQANSEMEITGFKSAPKCVICLEGKIDHVFTPCGHMCACEGCSKAHMKGTNVGYFYGHRAPKCPVCN